jgi:release factor glutamine methyltransferase
MNRMPSIAQLLRGAAMRLVPRSDSPRLDAELLLAEVTGRSRTALHAHGDEALAPELEARYEHLIDRRLEGVPVAYLTGVREFWSLPLRVSPAVLVPRPETETLVELVLARLPPAEDCEVLDLGTGSGAIALAIAKERPRARLTAVDVSPAALAVAAANGAALGLGSVSWHLGSWFDGLEGRRFDVIAANPPYVAADDAALAALRAEPLVALTPGPSGLEAFAAIAAGAPRHLRAGGLLALEHGAMQGADLDALLRQQGFTQISLHADAAGRPRVTLAVFHPSPEGLS